MMDKQKPVLKPRSSDAVLGEQSQTPVYAAVLGGQSQSAVHAAVLGGQSQSPVYAAVLGGVAGIKAQLNRPNKRQRKSAKGDTVETPLTDAEAIAALREIKSSFVQSLYRTSQQKPLSESQLVWAHKLALESLQEKVAERKALDSAVLTVVFQMLGNAGERLKFPKIRLFDPASQQEISLYTATEKSKYPGTIQVISATGMNNWYGRIEAAKLKKSAQFVKATRCPDWVEALIYRFAENPAVVAKEYGQLTGKCCFCLQKLTDGRSVEMGYGPVCAKNYRLPWGENTRTPDGLSEPDSYEGEDDEDADIAYAIR